LLIRLVFAAAILGLACRRYWPVLIIEEGEEHDGLPSSSGAAAACS